jgi:hypothetical protein
VSRVRGVRCLRVSENRFRRANGTQAAARTAVASAVFPDGALSSCEFGGSYEELLARGDERKSARPNCRARGRSSVYPVEPAICAGPEEMRP